MKKSGWHKLIHRNVIGIDKPPPAKAYILSYLRGEISLARLIHELEKIQNKLN